LIFYIQNATYIFGLIAVFVP